MVKVEPKFLKEVKLLEAFSEVELKGLIAKGKPVAFEEHSNVVVEGELSWGIYLIISGMVGVFKASLTTQTTYDVGQIGAGGFFGEMSLVDDQPRSATVKALTDCELYYISGADFQTFLNQSKDLKLKFYESCAKQLVCRLRELNDGFAISQYQLWKIALNKEEAA